MSTLWQLPDACPANIPGWGGPMTPTGKQPGNADNGTLVPRFQAPKDRGHDTQRCAGSGFSLISAGRG